MTATMKKTMPKTKTLFVITALFALVAATCEKAQTTETVQTANLEAGEAAKLVQPITEMEMVFVEGGTMTIQGQEIGVDSFYISRYVISGSIYLNAYDWAIANGYGMHGVNPSRIPGTVSNALMEWGEAVAVSNWLSVKEGLRPVYWQEGGTEPVMSAGETIELISGEQGLSVKYHPFYIDLSADGYRLPTEAEWEFAARGGNKSMNFEYAGSDTLAEVFPDANVLSESSLWQLSYIPGQMKPNELGIHDMSGPASEWVIGPWTEYGQLEPMHNPGRNLEFDFARPFYLLQKGGSTYVEFLGVNNQTDFAEGSSFRPESRIRFDPDRKAVFFDYELMLASVRLVRSAQL